MEVSTRVSKLTTKILYRANYVHYHPNLLSVSKAHG